MKQLTGINLLGLLFITSVSSAQIAGDFNYSNPGEWKVGATNFETSTIAGLQHVQLATYGHRYKLDKTTINAVRYTTDHNAPGMAPAVVPILFFVAGTVAAISDGLNSNGAILFYGLAIGTGTWSYFKYIRPKKKKLRN